MVTVLIGEDTADLGVAMARIFTRAGYTVRNTSDGPQTLAAARADPPDLLVLDVRMPGMSGLEVCQAVRADPATANVPVLMVSALPFGDDVAAGMAAGADDYVIKPFETADLVARAAALLSRTPDVDAV